AILTANDQGIDGTIIDAKAVGISLFGPYVLAVELASMLLLEVLHLPEHGRDQRAGKRRQKQRHRATCAVRAG
ncbi:hypothetical protein HZD82_23755, partial [Pantoea agglomerans]|nr:hypothetical protein [Pantoea agglomerans]